MEKTIVNKKKLKNIYYKQSNFTNWREVIIGMFLNERWCDIN